jgi:hypothetical protein
MKLKIYVFIAIALLFSQTAIAGGLKELVRVHPGFITGEQYLKMPDTDKRSYVIGLTDGILLSPLFNSEGERPFWFENCAVGMTAHQVAAIFTKYLEDDPKLWNQYANTVFFKAMLEAAMKEACK